MDSTLGPQLSEESLQGQLGSNLGTDEWISLPVLGNGLSQVFEGWDWAFLSRVSHGCQGDNGVDGLGTKYSQPWPICT